MWMVSNSNPFSLYSFPAFPVNKWKRIYSSSSPQMGNGKSRCELAALFKRQAFIFLQFLLMSISTSSDLLSPSFPSSLPPRPPDFLHSFLSSSLRINCDTLRIFQMLIGTQRWTMVWGTLWNNRKPNRDWLQSWKFICFGICKFQQEGRRKEILERQQRYPPWEIK